MNLRLAGLGAVVGSLVYLVTLSWAMGNVSYDAWGVLVVIPPMAVLGVLGIRRLFAGDPRTVASVMYLGLVVKLFGAAARYWVAFDAYGGATDAQRYHAFAKNAAGAVWSGDAGVLSVIPSGTGTAFLERLTALIYTLIGSSKLAAFVVFAWMGFWGVAFFLKAACLAVPGLDRQRYAVLCVLTPSLVYWPSSIGKEAWMILTLGAAALGFAMLLASRQVLGSLLLAGLGLAGAAAVRPHIAGIWLVGLFPALVVSVVRGRGTTEGERSERSGRGVMLLVTAIATVAAGIVGSAALRYLRFGDDPTAGGGITSILDETTRRTAQAGSSFSPPKIASPANWPYAVVRTLTRPLLLETHSAFQALSALEMTAFVVLCLCSARRIANLPRMVLRAPYVAFASTTVFVAGLAYSGFANLGVLTRQKSLVLPLMLLLPCLPARAPKTETNQKSSMSPSDRAQFDNGGMPASLTARQVRIGPA